MSIQVTEQMQSVRRMSNSVLDVVEVPVDITAAFRTLLREVLGDIPPEHAGWALTAVSASILQLVKHAAEVGGIETANALIHPRLAACLSSTAEALLVEGEFGPEVA